LIPPEEFFDEHPEFFSPIDGKRVKHRSQWCNTIPDLAKVVTNPARHLVHQVARGVGEEFPDKLVDTLAYLYSRTPPKTMRPEPNAIVRLCSIECCFNHPFAECPSEQNRAFVEDLVGWSQVCARLWVWDYVTSFSHYLTPFPNLHVRGPNIKSF